MKVVKFWRSRKDRLRRKEFFNNLVQVCSLEDLIDKEVLHNDHD